MELSSDQMAAVMHGMEKHPCWVPVDLPVGRQDLPDWLLDAHVDLMLNAANSPHVKFKVSRRPWSGPELWEREAPGAWTVRSDDGYVMLRHYHSGEVREMEGWRMSMKAHPRSSQGPWIFTDFDKSPSKTAIQQNPDKYSVEFQTFLVSDQQEGYGGSQFQITLKSGKILILRGPWHGSPPVGWTEAFVFDTSQPHNQGPYVIAGKSYPWHARGGSFGYFFSDDLVMKAVARYAPHLKCAKVYPGYGRARIEFYDANWGAPKMFAEERKPGWGPKR